MRKEKKDCMFQYIVRLGDLLPDYKNIEDTDLITWSEAVEMFNKYEDDFRKYLDQDDAYPEMGIWVNCKDNTDYHTTKIHLDEDTKWDGRRFYNLVREYIEV